MLASKFFVIHFQSSLISKTRIGQEFFRSPAPGNSITNLFTSAYLHSTKGEELGLSADKNFLDKIEIDLESRNS